jgi:threonine dehydrogenase-like Zn-dependent dehydrogenase
MRAVCWHGTNDLRVDTVPDPQIVNPRDAIVRVTATTTCGSDLHIIGGFLPTMRAGDIIGHEFMGEVMEVGPAVRNVKAGDRVVVPSFICCGACWYCRNQLFSLCDNTNPHAELQEPLLGAHTAGIYGYTHAFGGYAGSHAQYVRVPHADTDCFPVPEGIPDEKAVFISDALPTGFMGADMCGLKGGETVAVIAIDRIPERLRLARERLNCEVIDYSAVESVVEALKQMTGGRGPDCCIDAVGMEAHGTGMSYAYDRTKQIIGMHTDRGQALREAITACRKGGTVAVLGVYGVMDKFPVGVLMNKGLTLSGAQQHGQRYVPTLLKHVAKGELDPGILATHVMSLEDAPAAYRMFRDKQDACVRVVFRP